MPKTTFMQNAIIDHFLRGSSVATKTAYGLILTQSPDITGAFTGEIVGSGYARQAIGFIAPTLGATENAAKLSWTIPTAYTGGVTLTHIAIADASTAGNMMAFGPLSAPTTLAGGDVFSIDVADFDYLDY